MELVRDTAALRVKRNGFRVRVSAGDSPFGWEVDCKSVPRARLFEAWVERWRRIAPDLPVECVIERAMFAATEPERLKRKAWFWRGAFPEWTERQVYERAQFDLECALRFRARRKRARRM